jgi:hypothetical protein
VVLHHKHIFYTKLLPTFGVHKLHFFVNGFAVKKGN